MLINFLKSVKLSEANPPPNNENLTKTEQIFYDDSKCTQCGGPLTPSPAMILGQPSNPRLRDPQLIIIHSCNNTQCQNYVPFAKKTNAFEIPHEPSSSGIDCVNPVFLFRSGGEESAATNKEEDEEIDKIESQETSSEDSYGETDGSDGETDGDDDQSEDEFVDIEGYKSEEIDVEN